MEYQKLIQQIKKGETIKVQETTANPYEKVKVQIKKVEIVDTANSTIDHRLVESAVNSGKHTALICFFLEVKFSDNTKFKTQQVGYFLNSKGTKIAFHAGFEKDGKYYPETLLHEITRRCSEYSPEQEKKFTFDPFEFDPEIYSGMIFEIELKRINTKSGEEYLIFLTDYQRVQDEAYQKKLNSSENNDVVETALEDSDKLPF